MGKNVGKGIGVAANDVLRTNVEKKPVSSLLMGTLE